MKTARIANEVFKLKCHLHYMNGYVGMMKEEHPELYKEVLKALAVAKELMEELDD